jgi:hypothetical protein
VNITSSCEQELGGRGSCGRPRPASPPCGVHVDPLLLPASGSGCSSCSGISPWSVHPPRIASTTTSSARGARRRIWLTPLLEILAASAISITKQGTPLPGSFCHRHARAGLDQHAVRLRLGWRRQPTFPRWARLPPEAQLLLRSWPIGTLIDLSVAAARRLGTVRDGVVPVRIRVLRWAEEPGA